MTKDPTDFRSWAMAAGSWIGGILTMLAILVALVLTLSPLANATGRGGDVQFGDKTTVSPSFRVSPSADADATGVGIGIGRGGDGGNSKARASVRGVKAYGGNANQSQFQGQTLRNQTRIGVGVDTTDFNSVYSDGGNAKVRNNTTDNVTIQGDTVQYEAPKKPDVMAYAPDVNPSPATAPCLVPWGVSGGSGAALISLGASGATKDHGCAFGEVARRAKDIGNQQVAEEALAHMLAIVKTEAGITDTGTDGVASAAVPREYGSKDVAGHGDYHGFMHGSD